MKKKLIQIFVCAVVAMSLSLVACSPGASWVLVSKVDSGKTVSLHVNQELIVDLESNQTTGFQWLLAEISDRTVLGELSNLYNAPAADAPAGAGGIERWTFKGLKKGTARLSMEYSRPWQGGEKAAETFTLTIVVE